MDEKLENITENLKIQQKGDRWNEKLFGGRKSMHGVYASQV